MGATVGIQDGPGEVAALFTYNGEPYRLSNEQAWRVRRVDYSYLTSAAGSILPFTHVAGEALQPQERVITLRNAGTAPLEWRGRATNDWFAVQPNGGMLVAGQSTNVTVSLEGAIAALGEGRHNGSILLENLRDGLGTRFVSFPIEVAPAAPVLVVLTNNHPEFTGGLGGPFAPTNWSCIVSNSGNAALTWRVSATEPWVLLPTIEHELAPGETREVQIGLTAEAAELPAGLHRADLHFLNLEIGAGNTSLPLHVRVRSGLQSHTSGQVDFGTFKLSVAADPGSVQVIERSLDLDAWSPVYTNTIDAGGVFELWFPTAPQVQEFFRVRELH